MTQSDLNVGIMAGASENKLLQSRARGMLEPLSSLVAEIIVHLPFFLSRSLSPLIDTLDRLALLYPLRALAG
jgi:hypothetical protein